MGVLFHPKWIQYVSYSQSIDTTDIPRYNIEPYTILSPRKYHSLIIHSTIFESLFFIGPNDNIKIAFFLVAL